MHMMKRLWSVLFVLALVAAACGGSEEGTVDPDESAAQTDETDTGTADEETAPDTPADDDIAPLEDDSQITSSGEGSAAAAGDPVSGGEITWGLVDDGTGFDTTAAMAPGSIRIVNALSDSLVGLNESGEWEPFLAEALSANDDFTTWTITLRDGPTFHDGEPINADAVVANLLAFRNSSTAGFAIAPVTDVEAIDDLIVEVRMSSPWATFPYQLVNQPGWMVSPSTIGTNDTFVGTGPFMLESWTPGDGARAVRNPNYWQDGLPYLDAINFKSLSEQPVRRQALEARDIDGYISPGDADIIDFLEDDTSDVWIGEAGANDVLFILNTAKPPFDDLRVRQAMAYGLDRQFMIDTFRSGLTTPAAGPIHPSSRWYAQTDYPDYDPEKAAALIAEYEAEVGPVEFEMTSEPVESTIESVEVAMSFWADAGMDITRVEIGPGQSAITGVTDNFEAIIWAQFGGPDPDGMYPFFHSSGGILNWSNFVSAKIDEGLDMGRENLDFEARLAGYTLFQEALAEELPVIWWDHLNGIEAAVTRPELHGIGAKGELPSGSPGIGMTNGNFFSWIGVWVEQ